MMNLSDIFKSMFGKTDTRFSAPEQEQNAETLLNTGQFRLAKLRLASNPGTSSETLDKLAHKHYPEVLERVAENPHTDPITLDLLAANETPEVRSAVAENEHTLPETINVLAFDECVDVRYMLAENGRTPLLVLEKLVDDENPYVAERAKHTLRIVEQPDWHGKAS